MTQYMKWERLLSAHRLGAFNQEVHDPDYARSQFQRDYDRIIFSSPFRRLQNKTQVFPLPGSVFVHNRLTHSLEVASIGRSLAGNLAMILLKRDDIKNKDLLYELGAIVSAACLSHDLGNPPFGHSGEKAISRFFMDGDGTQYRSEVSAEQWGDLVNFEGNANAFRLLTHRFDGRREGGFVLTYSTLAALVKYPFGSDAMHPKKKKYGYFSTERDVYAQLADAMGIPKIAGSPDKYARHPLVYLVEAADDIAYQVMDIEDAHKLSILSFDETRDLLLHFFHQEQDVSFYQSWRGVQQKVTDSNEQIAFLRAMVINRLVNQCVDVFMEHYDEIMAGQFQGSLVSHLKGYSKEAMNVCSSVAVKKIYQHRSVLEIELTGYNVLGTLMKAYCDAVMNPQGHYQQLLLKLMPEQYASNHEDVYLRLQSVVDFVSGMTDLFALELYQKIKGIRF